MEEEVIIKQIVDSANQEAERIVKEALDKAREIEEKTSKAEAEKARQQFEIKKSKVLKLATSEVEKAEFEARSAELIERKKYIEIVKEKVKQKIMDLDITQYVEIITKILNQYKETPNVTVTLPNKCYEELKVVAEQYGMSAVQTDEFDSGVIVKVDNIEYNYDFEENMEFMNEVIEKEIDSLLFS